MAIISHRDQLLSNLYHTMLKPPFSTNSRLEDSLERLLRNLANRKGLAANPVKLAEAQGRLLASLAHEQGFSLHEIITVCGGIDVLYTDDAPEDGYLDPANPLSGNPTICVPKYVQRDLQKKALLDHYKEALDRPLEAQIYGTNPDTAMMQFRKAMMRFRKAQAAFTCAAVSQEAKLGDPGTK